MATSLASPRSSTPDLDLFAHHWQDEADAAFLYGILADAESDPHKRSLYRRLSQVEEKHVEIWGGLLRQHGRTPAPFRPSVRARVLASLGRRFGPGFLLPMLLREEGREVKGYLAMHRATPPVASPARAKR
jgi:vacuolar iron transporter family protein